jgi:hypothetical protein
VAAAAGAWIKEAAGGAAGRGLLAVRLSLHTEGEGAATLLLLELEPKHPVPEVGRKAHSIVGSKCGTLGMGPACCSPQSRSPPLDAS